MYTQRYQDYRRLVEEALETAVAVRDVPYARLWEAMAYSVGGQAYPACADT